MTERASQAVLLGASTLLFGASAAATIVSSMSMSAMDGMPMPGDWTMSMAWMRMPGQSWAGLAASFLGMWVLMTPAMMLPSVVPVLWRYRQAAGATGAAHAGALTAMIGAGYFFVWAALGAAVFPVGVVLTQAQMEWPMLARATPVATGAIVLVAGALQFTRWKACHLGCCREAPGRSRESPADAVAAWRHGLRLGAHCTACCAGLTAILLVVGVMDLRAMAIVTAAITFERLAPSAWRASRLIGVLGLGAGLWLIAQ